MKRTTVLLIAVFAIVGSFFADKIFVELAAQARHDYLDYVMSWFTNLNSLVIVFIVLTSLFLWEEKKTRWVKVIWLSAALSGAASVVLKILFERVRPGLYEGVILTQYSFPSMHAATAFSLIPVLDREFPKLKLFWLLFAILIAASRIYFGVHYLSDVVSGSVIGYLIGFGIVKLQERKKLEIERWKKKLHLS